MKQRCDGFCSLLSRPPGMGGSMGPQTTPSFPFTQKANADWVLGAFVDDALCGVAEIYCDKLDGDAEVALAVDRAWRSKGIGTALLHTMMQIAAEANTTKLRMLFSRRNWPMRRLASKAGGRFDVIFDTISVEVDLFKLKQSSRARSSSVPQTAA
jgi:GNAT superfamily N-acetyltransferase